MSESVDDDIRPFVESAQAMQRLMALEEFQSYQADMRKELELITEKITRASLDTLPGLQGALIQQLRIMKLPERVVHLAERLVKERHMDEERRDA